MVNLNKLNALFTETKTKKETVAEAMGITVQALGKKLSGKTKINCDDAAILIDALKINSYKDKVDIFLA